MERDERRRRLSDLYHAAVARVPADRDTFLRQACAGDEALRQEVASLLEYESSASARFLETPAVAVVAGPAAASHEDACMVGRTLGPYTIGTPLGVGGMGEVYRARDARLGRDVAIKILPANFTSDPERRARFAREARVLATLNHPHIGAIYGLEEAEGVTALVLELVEGPTLADRLEHGSLPVAQALAIARQIADALDAAHERGIVHRDLKPANIVLQGGMDGLSSEVRAKVLDFGLAKTLVMGPAGDLTAQRPGSFDGTADGRILGTPAYMSPEQARGLAVDKRTDVWALGCVLYEMLSGRRAFAGETITDTLSHILERQPDWAALPSDIPATIHNLVRKCLVKDPSRRLRDIGDLRLELDDIAALRPTAGDAAASAPRLRPIYVLLGALVVLVLATALWLSTRSKSLPGPSSGSGPSAGGPERLTHDEGLQADPAMSPDGRHVAYSSNRAGNFDIYTQPVAAGNAVPVTNHPAHDWQPDWSVKDQIVFRSEREGGGLYVVPQTGGHEQRVSPFGHTPKWSPDGMRILFRRAPSSRIYTVEMGGAIGIRPVCDNCGLNTTYGWRDNGSVSLLSTSDRTQFEPRLRMIELATLTENEWLISPVVMSAFRDSALSVEYEAPVTWTADGRGLYFIGRSLGVASVWKLDVSPEERSVIGGPHRLTAMADDSTGVGLARMTGAVAFAVSTRIPQVRSYRLDASGRRTFGEPEVLTSSAVESNEPDITPDGTRIVFNVTRPGGRQGVELRLKTAADDRILRVSDSARGEGRRQPHLSRDGRHVVFRYFAPESPGRGRVSGPFGLQQLHVLDLDTGEESELTKTTDGIVMATGWSPDGKYVVVHLERKRGQAGAKGWAIGLLPVAEAPDAESQMKVVTFSDGPLYQPTMSTDGRWIAFRVASLTDRRQIAVIGSSDGRWSEPQDARTWQFLEGDGATVRDKPRWSVDGRLLYYASNLGGLMNVWAVNFDPVRGVFGKPFQVTTFNGRDERLPDGFQFETAVGGGRLVIPTLRPTGGIWLLNPK